MYSGIRIQNIPDNNMASESYGLWADAKIGGVPQCYLDGVCLIYISIDIKKLNGQNKNFTTELSMDT